MREAPHGFTMAATTPSQANPTTGDTVELGSWAAPWASEMADSRRRSVETARTPG
jgi:hypothetical protein